MWHESLWFWNPKATHGSGSTPAHFPARFANETCFADMLHSYDEHIWRPMIIDDPATAGEHMASKPVCTAEILRFTKCAALSSVCVEACLWVEPK